MKNCKLIDSSTNVLIQMADMIAGSEKRFYEERGKNDREIYRAIFEKHIVDEWQFR